MTSPRAWSAELLERRPTVPGAVEAAARLRDRVELWMSQRLWSINLAPELVLHDDRHVSSVDRLVASLGEPLLGCNRLTARDIEILSCAAWLHDWGHVGGFVGTSVEGVPAVATKPGDVRRFHGMISQQFLRPEWSGMHGIADPGAAIATGVLCGHHQGLSSFGEFPGRVGTVRSGVATEVCVRPPSLVADLEDLRRVDGGNALSLSRARLLVALLRVADGADVGRHRVPDAGRAKGAFLAHCIRMQAWRASDEVAAERHTAAREAAIAKALVAVIEKAKSCAAQRLDTGDALHVLLEMDRELAQYVDASPAVRRLSDYVNFTAGNGAYYAAHLRVSHVRFEVERDTDPPHGVRRANWAISVVVTPAPGVTTFEAMRTVATDIEKELERGEGADTVRAVLQFDGVRFAHVRSPDGDVLHSFASG